MQLKEKAADQVRPIQKKLTSSSSLCACWRLLLPWAPSSAAVLESTAELKALIAQGLRRAMHTMRQVASAAQRCMLTSELLSAFTSTRQAPSLRTYSCTSSRHRSGQHTTYIATAAPAVRPPHASIPHTREYAGYYSRHTQEYAGLRTYSCSRNR